MSVKIFKLYSSQAAAPPRAGGVLIMAFDINNHSKLLCPVDLRHVRISDLRDQHPQVGGLALVHALHY